MLRVALTIVALIAALVLALALPYRVPGTGSYSTPVHTAEVEFEVGTSTCSTNFPLYI